MDILKVDLIENISTKDLLNIMGTLDTTNFNIKLVVGFPDSIFYDIIKENFNGLIIDNSISKFIKSVSPININNLYFVWVNFDGNLRLNGETINREVFMDIFVEWLGAMSGGSVEYYSNLNLIQIGFLTRDRFDFLIKMFEMYFSYINTSNYKYTFKNDTKKAILPFVNIYFNVFYKN